MQWSAWNNGQPRPSGAGYGLKVPIADRDAHFSRSQRTIILELPRGAEFVGVPINVGKDSFGTECRELISKEIGLWLMDQGLAPWPKGQPPKIDVEQVGVGRFRVMRPVAITPAGSDSNGCRVGGLGNDP